MCMVARHLPKRSPKIVRILRWCPAAHRAPNSMDPIRHDTRCAGVLTGTAGYLARNEMRPYQSHPYLAHLPHPIPHYLPYPTPPKSQDLKQSNIYVYLSDFFWEASWKLSKKLFCVAMLRKDLSNLGASFIPWKRTFPPPTAPHWSEFQSLWRTTPSVSGIPSCQR
jgi:hypothetical protein